MRAEHRPAVACALAVLAALSCRSADDPPRVIGDMVQLERLASAGDAVKIRDLLASDPGLAHASWASAQNGPLHIAAASRVPTSSMSASGESTTPLPM